MKVIILLSILFVLASSQCLGYKSSDACFNPRLYANRANGWGYISGCKVYAQDPPTTCTTCYDGISGTSCQTFGYKGFTDFPVTGTEEVKCYNVNDDYTYYMTTGDLSYALTWTQYSCVDSNKQMICQVCEPGMVFVPGATSYGTCQQCGDGCNICQTAALAKCTTCYQNYFLDATLATCTKCHANALTCASKTAAASCQPGYYLDAGACTQCTDVNSYCKAKDTIDSCKIGWYHDTTNKKCAQCAANVLTCISAPVTNSNSGVTECAEPDATQVFFSVTTKGCLGVLTSKKCKTVNASGLCTSCFTGYANNSGTCTLCSGLVNGSYRTGHTVYTEAIATCTGGSDTTAYTITCKDGYYVDTLQCKACSVNCNKCLGGAGSGAGNASQCTSIAAGYTKDGTEVKLCSAVTNYSNCKTCNDGVSPADNKCLTITADSGYAVYATDSKTYECGAAAKCKNCTLTDATHYTCTTIVAGNCMKATPGVVGDLIACPGSDVATCTCASNVEAVLTCASTKVKQTVIPAATPPVITCIAKADNHANCTDGTVDGSSNKACTKCDAAYKLETNKCTQCHASDYYFQTAAGTGCVKYVDNCVDRTATYNTLVGDVAKCSKCAATHVAKADQTACYDCAAVTGIAACKTKAPKATNDGCYCEQCQGATGGYDYYLKDGGCVADQLTNCLVQVVTEGKTVACSICNFGYKWDGTVCKVCDQANFKCATTGCASLDYPNKPGAGGSSTTNNVSVLQVVIALLLSIFTLLI